MNPKQKAELETNKKELQAKYIGAMSCDHCPGVHFITTNPDWFICETCGATSWIIDNLTLRDIEPELRADTIRHLFPNRVRKDSAKD